MKRILKAIVATAMCASMLCIGLISTNAQVPNPYSLISGGCVTGVEMISSKSMDGGLNYYTATVTSRIQGLSSRDAIPYLTYGAIGTKDTKMFVYSVGTADGQDYKMTTVKEIVERFEAENPAWNAQVAINGDFFDIETQETSDTGEPESQMIQQGAIYKAHDASAPGRGIVGTTDDGTMLYYTVGSIYREKKYGTPFSVLKSYAIQIFGEHRTNIIKEYSAYDRSVSTRTKPIFIGPEDSEGVDTTDKTVFVIKCDIYRRAHVGINGVEYGTQGYFVEGEIIESRNGKKNDLPDKGYVLVAVPDAAEYPLLQKGTYVRCQRDVKGQWEDVTNAVGFKQQILAEGTVLLQNCYGKYNSSGSMTETLKWTDDIYDYPYCWKHRTAIGFKADGTPVLLVIEKSSHTGTYSNLGASYYEIGEQLKTLGCTNGFLLDGGGSSTFVVRNDDGSFSNAFVGEGNGRAVANAVILATRDESVPLPTLDEVIPDETEPPKKNTGKVTSPIATDMTDNDSIEGEQDGETGCSSSVAFPAVLLGGVFALPVVFGYGGQKKNVKSKKRP